VDTFQIILIVIAAAAFGFAWRKGHLLRMAAYVGETKVELKKCNWPGRDELKASTVLVMVSVVTVGFFTFGTDLVISSIIKVLMK
jgi:preprotein translocase subunit SecE